MWWFWKVGAVHHLQQNYDLSRVQLHGSSSGAIVAVLAACGVDLSSAAQHTAQVLEEHRVHDRWVQLVVCSCVSTCVLVCVRARFSTVHSKSCWQHAWPCCKRPTPLPALLHAGCWACWACGAASRGAACRTCCQRTRTSGGRSRGGCWLAHEPTWSPMQPAFSRHRTLDSSLDRVGCHFPCWSDVNCAGRVRLRLCATAGPTSRTCLVAQVALPSPARQVHGAGAAAHHGLALLPAALHPALPLQAGKQAPVACPGVPARRC